MGLSVKSEVYGIIGFVVCAAILMFGQYHFGGTFDMVTALIVLISIAVYEIISNVTIDIEVSNK